MRGPELNTSINTLVSEKYFAIFMPGHHLFCRLAHDFDDARLNTGLRQDTDGPVTGNIMLSFHATYELDQSRTRQVEWVVSMSVSG